tara:strand:+ start:11433 stop:12263 length:831 start_codon:yes stop_codon:yes gene_type:complete
MNDFIYANLIKLKNNKIPNPEIDLRILLNYSRCTKNEIILSNFNKNQINIKKFNLLLKRRISNEPISKIINNKSFWKDNFYVNKFVLDPRPETEGIIEEAINICKNNKTHIKILDIGTGSGAIAISLAREFKNAEIVAIDISEEAIKVANKNIKDRNLDKRINLKKTTFENIEDDFDLIVSNPPYLTQKEIKNLANEIKKFEPKIALFGGKDGLDFYRGFSKKINKNLRNGGYLILEIGVSQLSDCMEIFNDSGLKFIKKAQDLQKKDRIMIFSKI